MAPAARRRLGLLLLLLPLLLLLLPPPPPGLLGAAGDDLPLPPGGQPVPPREAGGGGGGQRRLLSSSSAAPASPPPPEGLAAWLWLASPSSWSSLPLLPPEAQLGPECRHLLLAFAESSVRLTGCLARSARPVTVCQNCHGPFREVQELLENITRPAANTTAGNHCAKSLLMSDRLQIVVILSNFFNDTWKEANCANCLNVNGEGLSNSTVTFLALFNQSMTCFEHNLQRPEDNLLSDNQSDVCKNCNETYRKLNDMYNNMQKSVQQEESGEEFHLCIDIEDAMNITRRLWSTTFNCSVPCSDTVPVVAVSSFILFLPVVFYLSSFLHSKQKKRILMPSKRFQSHDSSVNIQENMN